MSTLAYDSTRPELIPGTAPAVLPYCDGDYAWSRLPLFPKALYRYITVLGDPDAAIADVETGDLATPAQWAYERSRKHPGSALIVYCNRSSVARVQEAMKGYFWHLFLSTLDSSVPREYGGVPVWAVQYQGGPDADYDKSIVWESKVLNRPLRGGT